MSQCAPSIILTALYPAIMLVQLYLVFSDLSKTANPIVYIDTLALRDLHFRELRECPIKKKEVEESFCGYICVRWHFRGIYRKHFVTFLMSLKK